MTVVEGGLVVAVVLLAIVVVALARTLTATTRRLSLLERQAHREERHDARARTQATPSGEPRPDAPAEPEGDAVDIRGADVEGRPSVVPLERTDAPTLLAFLSTSCGICMGIWERLCAEGLGSATGVVPVVVTKDPAEEDVERIRQLSAAGPTVVLSSEAWDDYEVPGSPYVMLVSAAPGSVVAEGTPARWEDLERMASGVGTAGEGVQRTV